MRTTFGRSLAKTGLLGSVLALAFAGTALADGASDQTFETVSNLHSNVQKAGKLGKASLFTQVQHLDNDNVSQILAQPVEEVYLDYDNSVKLNAKKIKKCDPEDLGENTTTQFAVDACPKSIVGAGSAIARIPTLGQFEFSVTAFNGLKSVTGQEPGDPNSVFDGNKPTLLLHSRQDTLAQSPVVIGEITDSPEGGEFDGGSRLSVPDAPDVANDLGSLVLFGAQVAKTTTVKKKGKKKKFQYVSAMCDDGNQIWNFHGLTVYDDASEDEDTHIQNCATK